MFGFFLVSYELPWHQHLLWISFSFLASGEFPILSLIMLFLLLGLFLVLSFSSTSMNLGCFVCVSSVYRIIWIYWLTLKSILNSLPSFPPHIADRITHWYLVLNLKRNKIFMCWECGWIIILFSSPPPFSFHACSRYWTSTLCQLFFWMLEKNFLLFWSLHSCEHRQLRNRK